MPDSPPDYFFEDCAEGPPAPITRRQRRVYDPPEPVKPQARGSAPTSLLPGGQPHAELEAMFTKINEAAAPCRDLADGLSGFCEAIRDRLRASSVHLPAEVVADAMTLSFARSGPQQWDILVCLPSDEHECGTPLTQAPLDTKIVAAPLLPRLVAEIMQLQERRLAQLMECRSLIRASERSAHSEAKAQ